MITPIAGPSLPSHLQVKEEKEDTDSEDDFMPQLPPGFKEIKKIGEIKNETTKPPIGPNLPPGFRLYEEKLNHQEQKNEDETDELDSIGPIPLPDHLKSKFNFHNDGVIALKEREERRKEIERIEKDKKLIKREEWMLLPPKELDLQSSIDPTKIKSRGFKQTSKPHSSDTNVKNQSNSLWTESPSERDQRLADEAIGKRRRAEEIITDLNQDLEISKRKKRDLYVREQVNQHNKSLRNESLLDLHKTASINLDKSKTKAEKDLEKKQAVIWDRESMMGINSKIMDENQKSNLIKDAKGLGGRFGGGSFL